MQIKNDSQVEPPFTRPDIADVTGPLLVWFIGMEVPVQQVWGDVGDVVAVGRHLVSLRPSTRMPFSRISRPTRRCRTFQPSSFSSSVIRGLS